MGNGTDLSSTYQLVLLPKTLLDILQSGFERVPMKALSFAFGLSAVVASMTPAWAAPGHEHLSVGEA